MRRECKQRRRRFDRSDREQVIGSTVPTRITPFCERDRRWLKRTPPSQERQIERPMTPSPKPPSPKRVRPSEVRPQPLLRTLTERAEKYGVSLTGLGINDEVPVAPPVPSRLQLDRPRLQHIPKDVHVVWSDDEEDQTLVPPVQLSPDHPVFDPNDPLEGPSGLQQLPPSPIQPPSPLASLSPPQGSPSLPPSPPTPPPDDFELHLSPPTMPEDVDDFELYFITTYT